MKSWTHIVAESKQVQTNFILATDIAMWLDNHGRLVEIIVREDFEVEPVIENHWLRAEEQHGTINYCNVNIGTRKIIGYH